jgi:hypothetical protein
VTLRFPALASTTQCAALLVGSYSLAKLVVFVGFNIGWFLRFHRLLVPSSEAEIACHLLVAVVSYGLFRAADTLRPTVSPGVPSNLESHF